MRPGGWTLAPAIRAVDRADRPGLFLGANAAGVAALLTPWLLVLGGLPELVAPFGGSLWTLGTVLTVGGFALWLAEPRTLLALLTPTHCLALAAPVILALVSFTADGIFWPVEWVKILTFQGTDLFLRLLGESPDLHRADMMILGVGDFWAELQEPCSGFSGMAMVSLVLFLYGLASRQRLRMERILILIPVAVLLSWVMNIVRISGIMLIGAYISPDLAINAFHSYAGWIAFTMLSALLMIGVESTPWFHREARVAAFSAPPFFADRKAAEILPFALFMTASLIVGASFSMPATGYPIIAAVTGLSIAAFFGVYRSALAGPSPLSVASGLLVAALWLAGQGDGNALPAADILGPAAPLTVGFWVLMRVLGTTVFIPLIEEMFFRSYLLNRLDLGGKWGKPVALVLSSAAFAGLHELWLLALVSGLIFGALVLRSGKVGDAIVAHMVANGTIALWAVVFNDWSVI